MLGSMNIDSKLRKCKGVGHPKGNCLTCGLLLNTENGIWQTDRRVKAGGSWLKHCVECAKKERKKYNNKHYLANKTQILAYIVARRKKSYYHDEATKIRPKNYLACHGQSISIKRYGTCIHLDCRYHAADCHQKIFSRRTSIATAADTILALPETCLWKYLGNGNPGMSYEEIAPILGVTKQRIEQIVNPLLARLCKKAILQELVK